MSIMGWDSVFDGGEYEGLTVLDVYNQNVYYLWFMKQHKGIVFEEEVASAINVYVQIDEMFVRGNEEDIGQGTFEAMETGGSLSLGQQVRDMWESEPEPDRSPSYSAEGEEVDSLGLEERDNTLWD